MFEEGVGLDFEGILTDGLRIEFHESNCIKLS